MAPYCAYFSKKNFKNFLSDREKNLVLGNPKYNQMKKDIRLIR